MTRATRGASLVASGAIVFAVAAAASFACSKFGEEADPTGTPEGGLADGVAVQDGDLPDGIAPSPVSPCNSKTADIAFCDDFDTDAGFDLKGWKPNEPDPNAAFEVSTDVFLSQPNAAECQVAPGGGNATANARLTVRVPGDFSKYEVSVDIYIRTRGDEKEVQIFGAGVGTGAAWVRTNGNVYVTKGATADEHAALPPLPNQEWTRVTMEIDLLGKQGTITTVMGKNTFKLDPATTPNSIDRPNLFIGPADCPQSKTGWSIVYDNVVVRRPRR